VVDTLRPYQINLLKNIEAGWNRGARRQLAVLPTGGGKTVVASEFIHREPGSVLFVVHRRDLVRQTAKRLRDRFGASEVGVVLPGADRSPYSRIQVGTVQTFNARGIRPDAALAIFDEAHHYAADDWATLLNHYSQARLLGLTATPQRADGKPLNDCFDELVVGARYSELLADGFLVPCGIFRPPPVLDAGDLAKDPLAAWQEYGDDSQTFVFCASVEAAEALARRFCEAGVPAKCIEANTPKGERDQAIAAFERGELKVITNVNTMTEGIDVPQARCVILARSFNHLGAYLQACGRVLRPHPTKPHAILIDLVGATYTHLSPTIDRDYSLDGEGIKTPGVGPMATCPACLISYPSRPGGCPACGHVAPKEEKPLPKIWDLQLEAVFDFQHTPVSAKLSEYKRLREIGRQRGWNLYFIQKEYKKLFGELPVIHDATEQEQRDMFERFRTTAEERGFKAGYVGVRFKEMFGKWPPRSWAA